MATHSIEPSGEFRPLPLTKIIVPEHEAGDHGPERGSSTMLYRAALAVVLAAGVGLVVAALDVTRT